MRGCTRARELVEPLLAVGVPVDAAALEAAVRAPAVAGVHLHGFGAATPANVAANSADHLARRDEEAVHLAALGVQERDHAPERHAVAGLELA